MVQDIDKDSSQTILTIEHSPNMFGTNIEDTNRKPDDTRRKRTVSRDDRDKANDAAAQAIEDYRKAKAKRLEKTEKTKKTEK